MHTWPPEQTSPQTPQLFASVDVLTHVPPHDVRPVAHPEHAPFTHVWPLRHALPHAPQLLVSVCRFAHELPLQSVRPDAHEQFFPALLQHAPATQLPQPP
jgi:hypothetical protein